MRSYLFKSTTDDVKNLDDTQSVNKTFNGIESNGIDPTTLTILESILSGEDFYNIHERGGYEVIKKIDEGTEVSYTFVSSSSNLIRLLKDLTYDEKTSILKKWCKTQEMSLYGWTPEKAERIIDWLISTSKDKENPDEKIMLFMETDKQIVAL